MRGDTGCFFLELAGVSRFDGERLTGYSSKHEPHFLLMYRLQQPVIHISERIYRQYLSGKKIFETNRGSDSDGQAL